MRVIEPSAQRHRRAAIVIALVAALTVLMIAAQWVETFDGPLLFPLVGAYLLFNFGFVFAKVQGRHQTRGWRLGGAAVSLNALAMLFSDYDAIWTALSASALIMALIAAYMLIKGGRTSGA